jgi:hypothetical protein
MDEARPEAQVLSFVKANHNRPHTGHAPFIIPSHSCWAASDASRFAWQSSSAASNASRRPAKAFTAVEADS